MTPKVYSDGYEINFASGDTSKTQAITTINQNKAFIIVRGTGANQDIERVKFRAYFSSNSEITVVRGESGASATAYVQVVWCDDSDTDPAFTVQSDDISIGSGDTSGTDTISDVGDVGQCTVFLGASCGLSDDTRQVMFRGKLNSTTQIGVYRTTSGSVCTVRYFVVKWNSDCNVYNSTITNNSDSNTGNIGGTIDRSRSALFITWDNDNNGLSQHATRGYLSSDTQITCERETSTGSNTVECSVVEFPLGVTVRNNNGSTVYLSSTGTIVDETISSIDLDHSFHCHWQSVTGTGSAIVRGETIAYLTSTTNLRFEKQYTGQNSYWNYFVIYTS
jgi:hypothetical protein